MSVIASIRTAFVALAALSLAACGINSVPTAEENAKARWADVQSAYQRRADLIPNLVATVRSWPSAWVSSFCASWKRRSSSGFDRSSVVMLIEVARARASVTVVRICDSDAAAPRTLATRLGIRSARRW